MINTHEALLSSLCVPHLIFHVFHPQPTLPNYLSNNNLQHLSSLCSMINLRTIEMQRKSYKQHINLPLEKCSARCCFPVACFRFSISHSCSIFHSPIVCWLTRYQVSFPSLASVHSYHFQFEEFPSSRTMQIGNQPVIFRLKPSSTKTCRDSPSLACSASLPSPQFSHSFCQLPLSFEISA